MPGIQKYVKSKLTTLSDSEKWLVTNKETNLHATKLEYSA